MKNRPEVRIPGAGASLLAVLCALCASAVSFQPAGAQSTSEFVPTFSTNSRVRQQVDRLNRLGAQKLWDEWLGAYQQLVDDPSDLVIARDEEFLVGVRYYCHQMLSGLPAAVRQKYRAVYDADAGRLYEKAAGEGNAASMREVYSRYRFSSHANRALLWIANHGLDGGRPELARVAYSRLAKEPTVSVTTLLRYALAADAAGKPAEARAVLERVRKEFGAQQVQVGGKNTTGALAADGIGGSMRRAAAAAGTRWASFAGESGDRRMSGAASGALKQLWDCRLSGMDPVSGPRVVIGYASGDTRSRFSYLLFPSVVGDRVWVQGQRSLMALGAADGKPAWEKQEPFLTSSSDIPNLNQSFRNRGGGSYYGGARSVQAAPSVEGHLLVTRLPLAVKDRDSGNWPLDYAIGAFDSRTGSLLWRRTATSGEQRALYFNLPTLQASTVLTGIATNKGGITEYSAAALDAGTGEPLWTTYLGAGSDPLYLADGSPAAVKDGLVWIESSHYTLNALDLLTGEVRLIYHYDPGRRPVFRNGFNSAPQVTNEPVSLIATGSGPVVFAPRWGMDVIALDGASGKLLWSSPKAPGQSMVGALIGVDQKHAYICGDYLQAINLEDGAREWTWDPQTASGSVGYAALAGDRIYVLVSGTIQVFNAADGRPVGALDTGKALDESAGFASLVVLDKMLLVSTRERVIAFAP